MLESTWSLLSPGQSSNERRWHMASSHSKSLWEVAAPLLALPISLLPLFLVQSIATSTVARAFTVVLLLPMLLSQKHFCFCFWTNFAVLSPLCCQIAVSWWTELAQFCWFRGKVGASYFGFSESSSSRLFLKHNKMYINSSSRQIRRNKATYGGVVYGPRKNKSCSKCADTFPIVLQLLPHDVPGFHSAASGGVASVLWCMVGPPSPLWVVLVWLVLYWAPSLPFCLFPMFRPNPPTDLGS